MMGRMLQDPACPHQACLILILDRKQKKKIPSRMFSLGEGIFVFCWILSFWLDQVTPFGTQKKCHYLNENYIIRRFRIQKMTH